MTDLESRVRTAMTQLAEPYRADDALVQRVRIRARRRGRQVGLVTGLATVVAVLTATVAVLSLRDTPPARVEVIAPPEPATVERWGTFDPGPLASRGEPAWAWTGDRLIVVGGLSIERYAAFDDGAVYDPATGQWRPIPRRPAPGRMMAVAWTGRELFVLGQAEGIGLYGMRSAHLFDPATDRWRAAASPPRGFDAPSAFWTGKEVLVWQVGGGALYDPATDRWRDIPPIDATAGGTPSKGMWLDKQFAVLGSGSDGGGPLRDRLWLFDPATGAWTGSSPPRDSPAWGTAGMAWTGEELLLAGAELDVAFAYRPSEGRWREFERTSFVADRGTAYFTAVPMGQGRVVAFVGSSTAPLHVWDPASSTWQPSGPAPGPLPSPDGVIVWTGSDVLLWGRAHESMPGQANAALRWTPG